MNPTFGLGEPNDTYAQYFSGKSFLNQLGDTSKVNLNFYNVTFEPGCHNNWHIHHAKSGGGQVVVLIPANIKHWHGAKKDSWFSHIAVEVAGEETANEWCEPVNDEEYNQLGE